MSKVTKEIPTFKNEDEEREFWSNHDSAEHVDWKQAEIGLFPNLKPSQKKTREGWKEQIAKVLENGQEDGNEPWEFDLDVEDWEL